MDPVRVRCSPSALFPARSRRRAVGRRSSSFSISRPPSVGRSKRCTICSSGSCAGCCATRTSTRRTIATSSTKRACVRKTSTASPICSDSRCSTRTPYERRWRPGCPRRHRSRRSRRRPVAPPVSRWSSSTMPSRGTGAMRRAGAVTAGAATTSACARCTTGASGHRRRAGSSATEGASITRSSAICTSTARRVANRRSRPRSRCSSGGSHRT